MVWASGKVYEGSWKEGKMQGYCKFLFSDGGVYEGEYENANFTGHGKHM